MPRDTPIAPVPPDVPEARATEAQGERISLEKLLDRPLGERVREYRYRFAQSAVFGVPVVALAVWGKVLGPFDSQRWAGVMQALLAGWVLYVNLGMLAEGIIRKRVTGDLLVTAAALGLYVWGLIGVIGVLAGKSDAQPTMFVATVALLCGWDLIQWVRYGRRGA